MPRRGYHLAIEANLTDIVAIVKFFNNKGFYLVDLCCVDYVEYLELVYFFNNHQQLCRVKVSIEA